MTWQSVLGACGLLTVAAALTGACAGTPSETETSSGDPTSTSGQTGTGGAGAAGGSTTNTGGSGGDLGPCGTDCSLINTPQCQVAQCNQQTGMCEVVNDEEGVACDDGLFCTISDGCSAGTCVGGPQNDCGMTPPQCTEVTCDEQSQTCSSAPAMDGAMCQDPNDLCLKGSTCSNGSCIGGQQDDCFFFPVPSDCHVATCNAMNGMCEAQVGNEGGACNDPNDLCTVNKICTTGTCTGGDPKNCSQLTQGCVLGVCDVNTGQCVAQNLMNNDQCDDLDPCTMGETCQNGQCANGSPVTACVNGDNCCPQGCTVNNDPDCATTDLDVGPHSTTYSSSGSTRGYWFTAPVSFTIKELRVPLDVGTGVQNIQVVKFLNGPPPNFSANTTNHQTLFYTNNVSGSNYFVVNIPVLQGDIIGILGARGTTTMLNSYGSGNPYNTTIFGQPMALQRLVYQVNVNTTQAGPLSTETGGSYSRIDMRYGP